MVKFCGKCGAELKEGSRFCVKCGAPTPGAGTGVKTGAGSVGVMAKKASPVKKLVIPMVAVLVVLAVLFGVFGTKGYEKPIKYIEKGINEGDIQTIMKAFPEGVGDLAEMLPDDLSDMFPGYEMNFDVVGKEKIDKKGIVPLLSDEYDMSARELSDVKAAYILSVEMSAVVDGEEKREVKEIPVVKKDGKWVIPISIMM